MAARLDLTVAPALGAWAESLRLAHRPEALRLHQALTLRAAIAQELP
jgi:hypothetical protein